MAHISVTINHKEDQKMINYREILRLSSLGYTQHQIASSLHCSRNTVRDVSNTSKRIGIKWPLDDSITNEDLDHQFHPERNATGVLRKEPNYEYIHNELAKKGVNLSLLWSEYCEECYTNGENPYMYTMFCTKYRKWARITKATMRIKHKPGEVMQVDWAGNAIPIYDRTGREDTAYVFVAVLPCSCYAYAEVCSDMLSETWLLCHSHAYTYFGGVTRLLIPDNLKTGVTSNTVYDTILNRSYEELATYYDTAIVPARVDHPKDKSLAEGTVKYASTWIIATLRNQKFFSIEEARLAVQEKLEELNHAKFKKREGNRYDAYHNEELSFMKPLPLTPYEPAVWSTAKVPLDYLISDGKNKYSVPFDLIGETVDIRLTKQFVEVFFNGSRVALHQREPYQIRDAIVVPEHMPEQHRKYLSYNTDSFNEWAISIGHSTEEVVKFFLESGKEPEQGYKACVSLINLCRKYGEKKLEKACEQVLRYASSPSIRTITSAIKAGNRSIDIESTQANDESKHHGITRGAAYYSRDKEVYGDE